MTAAAEAVAPGQWRELSPLQTTRQMLRYRWRLYAAIALLWFAFYTVPLTSGLFVKGFFDALAGRLSIPPFGLAGWGAGGWLALLLGAAVLRELVRFTIFLLELFAGHAVRVLIGRNLLLAIVSRPGGQALPGSAGESISRFRDDASEVAVFTEWVLVLPAVTAFALTAVWMLVQVSPTVAVAALLPLLLSGVIYRVMIRQQTAAMRSSRAAAGEVAGWIGDLFGASQALAASGSEERAVGAFRRVNDGRQRAAIRLTVLTRVQQSFSGGAQSLATAAIILLAGGSMRAGSFSVGDLALFMYYLAWFFDFVTIFGFLLDRYRRLDVSLGRLVELLRGPAEDSPVSPEALVQPGPAFLRGALPDIAAPVETAANRLDTVEVRGLTYRHRTSGRGITGVDLRLKRGTLTVVTGQVGSGKSTLLRVLLGLLPRDAGEVRWNGQSVEDLLAWMTPPRCAYTPQVPRLFSETLRDNILLGLPDEPDGLGRALRLAVLEQDVAAMDQGLDTLVGPRGLRLSGGQVQRTAAARMFVTSAELLVFDDLSSALDVETEAALWEQLFGDAQRRPTALAVSHRRPVLQRADLIVLLKNGTVVGAGPLSHLLATSEEMQRLWMGASPPDNATSAAEYSG
jgi:ATP-binding cassette subfamily B protein